MVCPACRGPVLPADERCARCGADLRSGSVDPPHVPVQPARAPVQGVLEAGTVLNGRYKMVRVLGSGAFGRVYLAEDIEDPGNAPLAIKELQTGGFTTSDEQRDAMSWFKREVSALLTVDHPGIPAIHGYWSAHRTSGPLYLAMDYIPGKTLAQQGVPASWPQAVAWGIALCDVLAYLHSRMPPFIFRDVKPANVLIDERTNAPMLIDFGLARHLVPSNGTAIGTWGYVPMEQVLGKAETRSDLYALGAVLHELISGRRPDQEYRRLLRSGQDVEGAIRSLFPPIETLVPGVPASLSAVLQRATAFLPEARFPTAHAFAGALYAVLQETGQLTVLLALSSALASGHLPPTVASPASQSEGSGGATAAPSMLMPAAPSAAPATPHVPATAPVPVARPPVALPDTPATALLRVGPQAVPDASSLAASLPGPAPTAQPEPAPAAERSRSVADTPPSGASAPSEPLAHVAAAAQAPSPPAFDVPFAIAPPAVEERGKRRWPFRSRQAVDPAPVFGKERLVVSARGNGQFTRIGDAIERASLGARIEVEPGLYQESLVLNKPVEIVGTGQVDEVIVEAIGASCLLVRAEQALVSGLTMRYQAGRSEGRFYAVNIPSGNVQLEECQILSDALASVAIHDHGAAPTIRRCVIRNSTQHGMVIYGHGRGVVEQCDIVGNTLGLRISGHAHPLIRGCRVHRSALGGVVVAEHGRGTLEDCEIVENGHHGVSIRQGSQLTVRRCRIKRNGWSGINVADISGAVVERCDLTGNLGTAWDIQESAKLRVVRRENTDL